MPPTPSTPSFPGPKNILHSSNPTASSPPTTSPSLSTLTSTFLPHTSLTHPPPKPHNPSLTASISALQLHPSLEACLHIMNADLPSAHFLVRHMQAPPAVEGMLMHSILHRCEGDFRNARLWVGDVCDICEGFVMKKKDAGERLSDAVSAGCKLDGEPKTLIEWVYGGAGGDSAGKDGSGEEEARRLIDDVEAFRKGKNDERRGAEIEERIREELGRVLEWCKRKFGEGKWEDASSAWVRPGEEVKSIGNDMVSGDKGWRKF